MLTRKKRGQNRKRLVVSFQTLTAVATDMKKLKQILSVSLILSKKQRYVLDMFLEMVEIAGARYTAGRKKDHLPYAYFI